MVMPDGGVVGGVALRVIAVTVSATGLCSSYMRSFIYLLPHSLWSRTMCPVHGPWSQTMRPSLPLCLSLIFISSSFLYLEIRGQPCTYASYPCSIVICRNIYNHHHGIFRNGTACSHWCLSVRAGRVSGFKCYSVYTQSYLNGYLRAFKNITYKLTVENVLSEDYQK